MSVPQQQVECCRGDMLHQWHFIRNNMRFVLSSVTA